MRSGLTVLRAGLLSTVQDLGRPGLAHLGVPRSGAADPASLRLANRLVGNPPDAAGIETTLLGVEVRFDRGTWVAVTGAVSPLLVDGRPAHASCPQYVAPRATLAIGPARHGVRAYLAVAGGVTTPPLLGSRSTDTLSGLGPAPLVDGARVPLGLGVGEPAAIDIAPSPRIPDLAHVRLIPGPREDWFNRETSRVLFGSTYVVDAASNRIGARLHGPPVRTRCDRGLASEGMVVGAVQVPPSGHPIVFLADHPTTGGYPVVGVVHPDDLWLIAQARPGTTVRFSRSTVHHGR